MIDNMFFYFFVIVFVGLILKALFRKRYPKANSTNLRKVIVIKRQSDISKNELLEKIYVAMLESDFYKSVSLIKGEIIITAKTKTTMKSWGEIVIVNIADSSNGIEICIDSSCVVKTTQFDWGKNNKNIGMLLKIIDSIKDIRVIDSG